MMEWSVASKLEVAVANLNTVPTFNGAGTA